MALPPVPKVPVVAPKLPPAPSIEAIPPSAPSAVFNGVMHDVKSSSVSAIGYDAGSMCVLYPSGKTYVYPDVLPEHFNSVVQSASVGSTLRSVIKDRPFIQL